MAAQLEGSAIVDGSGHPMAVYHFTPEMEFETFERGDIGFHFGTKEQAEKRGKNLKAESGRMFRVYLNIRNPYRVRLDLNTWWPSHIGLYLWSEDVLTNAEWSEIKGLDGRGYDTPGARRLREILSEKGIDGFVYPNMVEGAGDSYIALYDAQIVRTDVLPGDRQYSVSRTRYSVEDTAGDPAQAYSYEALVAKPDMKLTVIDDTHEYVANSQTRKEIVRRALENAADSGRMDHGGRISIYVPDIKSDVIVSGNSLKHGLDRRLQQNAAVTENVGKILQEAVRVNELVPKKQNAAGSYVLLGAAQGRSGRRYIVEFIVNSFDDTVKSVDVLYSLNTKKESAVLNAPSPAGNPLTVTDSKISIAWLLEIARENFPDVLPQSVLAHYGLSRPGTALGRPARNTDVKTAGQKPPTLGFWMRWRA